LSEGHGRLGDGAGLVHVVDEVVALAAALAHAREDGVAAVLLGDVVDELHDEDGLADAGAAEEADLAALGIGGQKINDLDAGFEKLRNAGLFLIARGGSVDGHGRGLDGAEVVDGIPEHVDDAAQHLLAHGDADARAGVCDGHAAAEAVGGVECDTAHLAGPGVAADLHVHARLGHEQIVQPEALLLRVGDGQHRAADLCDDGLILRLHGLFLLIAPDGLCSLRLRHAGGRFRDLLRDLRLARGVEIQRQFFDEIVRVARGAAHCVHAGEMLRRKGLDQRVVNARGDELRRQLIEYLLRRGRIDHIAVGQIIPRLDVLEIAQPQRQKAADDRTGDDLARCGREECEDDENLVDDVLVEQGRHAVGQALRVEQRRVLCDADGRIIGDDALLAEKVVGDKAHRDETVDRVPPKLLEREVENGGVVAAREPLVPRDHNVGAPRAAAVLKIGVRDAGGGVEDVLHRGLEPLEVVRVVGDVLRKLLHSRGGDELHRVCDLPGLPDRLDVVADLTDALHFGPPSSSLRRRGWRPPAGGAHPRSVFSCRRSPPGPRAILRPGSATAVS